MTLIVDLNDLLDADGDIPARDARLRRRAIRMATLVEYGGTLEQLESRETMITCRRRPSRTQCLGFLWVMKLTDDRIQAHCPACGDVEAIISGWQGSLWADGPLPPLPMTDD